MRDYCDAQAGFWLHSKFWSKFSSLLQNTPPPILENFRFGMTKVYSGIPPPGEFKNTESYYMWRLYPTRITTRFSCDQFLKKVKFLNKVPRKCLYSYQAVCKRTNVYCILSPNVTFLSLFCVNLKKNYKTGFS